MRSRYVGKERPSATATIEPPAEAPAAGPLASLRVKTLGDFLVWRGDDLLSQERWGRRRVAALFKCLLTAPDQRLHRDQLIDWLWPDAEATEGAHRLRTTIHLLRQALEDVPPRRQGRGAASYVRAEGPWLSLDPAPGQPAVGDWLDVLAFDRLAARALAGQDTAVCREALALYDGPYLPADVYADWATVRREALHQRYLALLLHLADLSAGAGDMEQLEWCLRAVLAAEPCHEDAARRLMSALAGAGRRIEAIQVYSTLLTRLRDDLDVQPGRETEALYRRLIGQEAAPAGSAPPASNLPASLTTFIGRRQEQVTIRRLLCERGGAQRLVTLTGAGGSGKTRLALRVATDLRAHYPDGVWLVELATVQPRHAPADPTTGSAGVDLAARSRCSGAPADPEPVARAVAHAIGVADDTRRPLLNALEAFLKPRRAALVLDNCEHLVEACGRIAHRLLATCPRLQILATSREALGIAAELAWGVPPLALPAEHDPLTPEAAMTFDAIRLFVDRARRSRPDFAITAYNASLVVEICRRLDGMPLAIELATARLSLLSLDGIAARLDDRFRLLTAGNRAALPRQQTLRATMDWSYALLTPPERTILRRLAIFAGSFTLEAAEAICAVGDIEPWMVLDLLFRLVAKSLVVSDGQEGEMRCRLLETVRQYAREHLLAAGDAADVRERHCAWYVDLAERAERASRGPDQQRWLDTLEREHDNLRLALTWPDALQGAEGQERIERRLRLTAALRWFWSVRGHLSEGRRWLEEARAAASSGPSTPSVPWRVAYASVVSGAGWLAQRQGDLDAAARRYAEAMALRSEMGDRHGVANATSDLGRLALAQGEYDRALAYFAETLGLRRDLDDRAGIAATLYHLGYVLFLQGRYDPAETSVRESLALRRVLADTWGIATTLSLLGTVRWGMGDLEGAAALQEEALAIFRQLQDRGCIGGTLNDLGMVLRQQQNYPRARAAFEESLALRKEVGDRRGVAGSLGNLGFLALQEGDAAQAAHLLARGIRGFLEAGDTRGVVECLEGLARAIWLRDTGRSIAADHAIAIAAVAEGLRAALSAPRRPAEQAAWDDLLASLRAASDADRFEATWRAGADLTAERAVALADAECGLSRLLLVDQEHGSV